MEGYVKSHTEHGITTIEFFHPQGNSLPGKILEMMAQEIHYASTHESKVVILQSAGSGAFCAGASFHELAEIQNEKEGLHFFSGFANLINSIRKCHKLVIGRIHGKCVGGGVGIAAACDYAIALHTAEVKLSELAIGIGPFVVGPAIERKIGVSAFSQLAIDATLWRNADWAKKKG
ncbi:MAG: enoyl-CoA hydratase/isomerase family protein, partial [Ginsengibacter sp.]